MDTDKLAQRQAALQTANKRKYARAQVKRELKACSTWRESTALLAEVLGGRADDPAIGRAHVIELLRACARVTVQRRRYVLSVIGATDGRRVCELTERQFVKLLDELRNPTL